MHRPIAQRDLHELLFRGQGQLIAGQGRNVVSRYDGVHLVYTLVNTVLAVIKQDTRRQHRDFYLVVPVNAPPHVPLSEEVLHEVGDLPLYV